MKRHCLVKSGRKNRTWRWACLRESNNNKFHKKKLQLGLVYRILSFNFCKKIASAIVQPSPDSLQRPHGRSAPCMGILTRQCKARIAKVASASALFYLSLFCICTITTKKYAMYSILNLHYHMCIWVNDFIFTIISTPNVGSTNLVLFFVWRISNEVRDTVQSYGSVPSKTRPGPVDRWIGRSSMDWCGRTGLQDSCGEKPSEIGMSFPKADCLQISKWLCLPRNTTLNQKVLNVLIQDTLAMPK